MNSVSRLIQTHKNGPSDLICMYEIDESKPKCYVEGLEYKFNSRILFSFTAEKTLSEQERHMKCLLMYINYLLTNVYNIPSTKLSLDVTLT